MPQVRAEQFHIQQVARQQAQGLVSRVISMTAAECDEARAAQFQLVWIARERGRDVVFHCDGVQNVNGATAASLANDVRLRLSTMGVPRDALWFEVVSRETPETSELLRILNRSCIVRPVEFSYGSPTWGRTTTLEEISKMLGIEAALLKELCQVQ